MKSFKMPLLSIYGAATRGLATSLLGLCLLSGLDTPAAHADFVFGEPTNLGPSMNSPGMEAGPCLSADGKQLYFTRWTDTTGEIWACRRATVDSAWEPASRLGPPLATDMDECPSLTPDGLSLYFDSWRDGGSGGCDLWMTTATTPYGSWGAPANLGATVNSASDDWSPSISTDGLELYFSSNRPGGFATWDVWMTTRGTVNDPWGTPMNLGASINTEAEDCWPCISPDGLVLFFTSNRAGGQGSWDLYMVRRATRKDPWGSPKNLGPLVNSPEGQGGPKVSFDGSTLYFYSLRSDGAGQGDIWQTPILPTADFNVDGIVDVVDVFIMLEHWHMDYALCDIGPMPWGDGFVDAQDLIVLAEHLSEGHGSTAIERRISAVTDNAEEALNAGYTNWNYSSDLEIVDDHDANGGRQLIGLTFRDIYIAPGEVISNAYIEFVCDETKNGTDAAYFLIWGHLTPNSEGFIAPFVISNRPKTQAKVPWEPDPWSAVGQKIQTVNIASIIQELIDQEGWTVGNAVEIIIGEDPSKPAFTGVRCAESYDGSPANAPLLHIEIAVP